MSPIFDPRIYYTLNIQTNEIRIVKQSGINFRPYLGGAIIINQRRRHCSALIELTWRPRPSAGRNSAKTWREGVFFDGRPPNFSNGRKSVRSHDLRGGCVPRRGKVGSPFSVLTIYAGTRPHVNCVNRSNDFIDVIY